MMTHRFNVGEHTALKNGSDISGKTKYQFQPTGYQ